MLFNQFAEGRFSAIAASFNSAFKWHALKAAGQMDCRIKWSSDATVDLEVIAEFNSRDSEFYARTVLSKDIVGFQNPRRFSMHRSRSA